MDATILSIKATSNWFEDAPTFIGKTAHIERLEPCVEDPNWFFAEFSLDSHKNDPRAQGFSFIVNGIQFF